jgi:hypothetical protein
MVSLQPLCYPPVEPRRPASDSLLYCQFDQYCNVSTETTALHLMFFFVRSSRILQSLEKQRATIPPMLVSGNSGGSSATGERLAHALTNALSANGRSVQLCARLLASGRLQQAASVPAHVACLNGVAVDRTWLETILVLATL